MCPQVFLEEQADCYWVQVPWSQLTVQSPIGETCRNDIYNVTKPMHRKCKYRISDTIVIAYSLHGSDAMPVTLRTITITKCSKHAEGIGRTTGDVCCQTRKNPSRPKLCQHYFSRSSKNLTPCPTSTAKPDWCDRQDMYSFSIPINQCKISCTAHNQSINPTTYQFHRRIHWFHEMNFIESRSNVIEFQAAVFL